MAKPHKQCFPVAVPCYGTLNPQDETGILFDGLPEVVRDILVLEDLWGLNACCYTYCFYGCLPFYWLLCFYYVLKFFML